MSVCFDLTRLGRGRAAGQIARTGKFVEGPVWASFMPESDREVSHEPDEDGPWWDEGQGDRGEAEDFEHRDDGLDEVSDWFPEEA